MSKRAAAKKAAGDRPCKEAEKGFWRRSSLPFLLALAVMASCVTGARREIGERSVENFHRQLDSEQYQDIYAQAGDEFRTAKNEFEWTTLLLAIHKKLGNVQRSDLSGSRVTYSNSGTILYLVYNTDFSSGKAVESFSWRVKGNQAKLVGYYINSSDLITK